MRQTTNFRKTWCWFRCPRCGHSTLRAPWRVETSTNPPQVEVRYLCQTCSGESKLQGTVLNPGVLMVLAGIPLFVFTLCGLGYLLPGGLGLLQWLVATVGGAIVAQSGVLLIE